MPNLLNYFRNGGLIELAIFKAIKKKECTFMQWDKKHVKGHGIFVVQQHYKLLNTSFSMPNLLNCSIKVLRRIHHICLILSGEKEICEGCRIFAGKHYTLQIFKRSVYFWRGYTNNSVAFSSLKNTSRCVSWTTHSDNFSQHNCL
jgi:hypothetical protein